MVNIRSDSPETALLAYRSLRSKLEAEGEKVKEKTAEEDPEETISFSPEKLCGSCGGKLVERFARNGSNPGPFLGCENFRLGCRYTEALTVAA